MIDNLYEINRILLAVNELSIHKRGANESSVSYVLERDAVEAKFRNHARNIEFCIEIKLLSRKDGRLFITPIGERFFQLRTIEQNKTIISLNENQKNIFLELLSSAAPYKNYLHKIVSHFRLDYTRRVWFCNVDNLELGKSVEMANVLLQSGFLTMKETRIEVNPYDNDYFSKMKNGIKRSEAQLLDVLHKQRITGDLAEQLTLDYEKRRLAKGGFGHLALAAHIISKEDVFAGYDVLSYDGKSSSLEHDRFIEVKGTAGDEPVFYWSKNEIDTAYQYGRRYWLYLWTNIDSTGKGKLYRTIQDPYTHFFKKNSATMEPVVYMARM